MSAVGDDHDEAASEVLDSQWHSEGRNGTPRKSGVGPFQPYKTRLCDTFKQCQMAPKPCPKSCHFVPNRGILS